jgi:phosphoribosyl-ATP pyrophosphohydrolase
MESNEIQKRPTESYPDMVARLFKKFENPVMDLLHGAVGCAGETGEIMLALENNNEKNLIEELGDFRFYMQAIMNTFGWDRAAFEEINVNDSLDPFAELLVAATDVLDQAKKSWVYGRAIDEVGLHNFVGKMFNAYLELCNNMDLFDDNIQAANMYKLSTGPTARYPLGYSDAAAIARADKVAEEAAEKSPFKDFVFEEAAAGPLKYKKSQPI